MEIDLEKIKKRFSEINNAVSEIKKITSLKDDDFWSEGEHMAAVKYYLLQAIEAAGSVCTHVSAKKANKAVSSFGECFEVLEKEKLLDHELSDKLRKMVKFRNKPIHRYWEIDDKNILEYTRNELGDFEEFIKGINRLINE